MNSNTFASRRNRNYGIKVSTNAANELLAPNLVGDRGGRIAFIDKDGPHTYAEVAKGASRFANLLLGAGIEPGQRVLLALHDTVAFPICFLGAMRAGIVPIPLNTLMTADDYAFIAEDCGAAAVVASGALVGLLPQDEALQKFVTDGGHEGWRELFPELDASASDTMPLSTELSFSPQAEDDVAFWLYTPGTTGKPKGVMHSHGDLLATAENYGHSMLLVNELDFLKGKKALHFHPVHPNMKTFDTPSKP